MNTLETLLALQQEHGFGDVHLIHLHASTFDVAHTDDERAGGTNTADCPVHEWLADLSGPPATPGVYVVTPEADEDSMSYRSDPFALLELPAR